MDLDEPKSMGSYVQNDSLEPDEIILQPDLPSPISSVPSPPFYSSSDPVLLSSSSDSEASSRYYSVAFKKQQTDVNASGGISRSSGGIKDWNAGK